MSKHVTITLSEAAARAFLEVAEYLGDRLSAAGCNDLPLTDTPENREFYELLGAENVRTTVEAWRVHPDYDVPRGHGGKLYFMDYSVFHHVVRKVRDGVGGQESPR